MYYKNACYNFIKIFCTLLFTAVAVIYISDPYRLFHERLWHKNLFYSDFRVQSYALIKYQPFDSIIMGTSMLENTSAVEASEKLGGKWINLSYSAQRARERFGMLRLAFENRKIDNIIISMDESGFIPNNIEQNFEIKLYDDDFLTKWKIYSKSNAMSCIFLGRDCDLKVLDLADRPNEWAFSVNNKDQFGGFDNWLKVADSNIQIQSVLEILLSNEKKCDDNDESYKQTVDTEIAPFFEHNDTVFHLIIPPYSALYWAHFLDEFNCKMKPYKYLIEKAKDYPNVKIYWLYDEEFVFDIANYKDLLHYSEEINSTQLDYIKQHSHIIDVSNYEGKMQNFEQRLKSFDIQYYMDKIKKYYDSGDVKTTK